MLLFLNKFFKRPAHPFNMQNDGTKTYAQWQYEKGANTIEFYTQKYTAEEMFKGKKVLDVGCGAAVNHFIMHRLAQKGKRYRSSCAL